MGYIPSIISTDTVTFFINGAPYSVDRSFHGFQVVLDELKKADPNVGVLIAATQPVTAIKNAIDAAEAEDYLPKGTVSVTKSEVRYNDQIVTGVLVDRILALLAEGFDIMPMVRFLENVYQNPADFAREELYLWLENNNLPITQDGHFLAYKMVRDDFTSHHDNKTDNTPGVTVSMPRQSVDPVRDHTCSRGLHFCSHSYVGSVLGSGTIVILKVNPADVVSIPSDHNNAKGRAWKYDVLSVFGEDPHTKVWPSVVSPEGETVVPVVYPYDDDDVDYGDSWLDINSDLAKALFAACNEIGMRDRDNRLDWACAELGYNVDSFTQLTVDGANELLTAARAEKEAADIAAVAMVHNTQATAIRSYGIETLRRLASSAKFSTATGRNPYKEARKDELVAFLISKIPS